MKASRFLVFGLLLGLTSASFAAEDDKNKQIDELTSMQLGNYNLKYEGEAPRKTIAPDAPPGMTNFRRETNGPFLGLKFSTPLNNEFFKPGR